MNKKGFSLLETLITIIIIGILSTVVIQYISAANERSLDDQAKNNLILIQRAESIYKIENHSYYPAAGSVSVITTINQNLGLFLPAGSDRAWNYEVWSTGCSRATRNGGNGRSWFFTIADADDKPDAGAGCP
jgi:prepilin-type N-terminal cleavage/methylation domain-containing protein